MNFNLTYKKPGVTDESAVKIKSSKEREKLSNREEKKRHYVDRSAVRKAIARDGYVIALCGREWKPTFSTKELPICSKCNELYSLLDRE
jgi:hypothetical protein